MRVLAGLRLVPTLALLALSLACAGAPEAQPRREPPAAELLPFLLEPEGDAADASFAAVLRLHRQLVTGRDAGAVLVDLAASGAQSAAARVVVAQAQLVAGRPGEALASARAAGDAGRVPARLLEARSLEATGDLPGALEAYLELAQSAAAAERASRLEGRVIEILAARVGDAMDRGALAAGEAELARLQRLRPHAPATLELALRMAQLREDRPRELALARSLSAADPGDLGLLRRRARLEVELGDVRAGLELYGALVAGAPGDATLADEQRRASFRWRVLNSPESVRKAAAAPQLSRADLAVMLYWLVPQVRTSRGGAPRIASDVLDHPAREEIVRVVNLGLLPVDDSLHLFHPDRPLRRIELLRALVGLAVDQDPRKCASSPVGGQTMTRDEICAASERCGLLADAADCLPGGPCSGSEALELVRIVLDRLEAP